jgi:hypothetical protein
MLLKSWMLDLIMSSLMIFLDIIWGTKVRGTKGPSKEVGDFFSNFCGLFRNLNFSRA